VKIFTAPCTIGLKKYKNKIKLKIKKNSLRLAPISSSPPLLSSRFKTGGEEG